MHHGKGIGALASPARLSVAMEALGPLPEGRIAAYRPPVGTDLSPLGGDVHVIHGFRPDHDRWSRTHPVSVAPEGDYAAAAVFLPRSREAGRDLIAQAMALLPPGAPVIVDGQKTDGVDGVLRSCRKYVKGTSEAVSKAHGKTFRLPAGTPPESFPAPERRAEGMAAPAGGFSAGKVDRGSALLADALPAHLPPHVVDLGAGWGFLSRAALAREGVERIDLVEAEHPSAEAARANLEGDARVHVHWADATAWTPETPPDLVICNPPFHQGRAAEPALGAAFIAAAARMLAPRGALLLVANRHLPYEAALSAHFAEVREAGGDAGFKIVRAERPRRRSA